MQPRSRTMVDIKKMSIEVIHDAVIRANTDKEAVEILALPKSALNNFLLYICEIARKGNPDTVLTSVNAFEYLKKLSKLDALKKWRQNYASFDRAILLMQEAQSSENLSLRRENQSMRQAIEPLEVQNCVLRQQNQSKSIQIENLSREVELLNQTTGQLRSQNSGLIEHNLNNMALIARLDRENKNIRRTLEPLKAQNVELTHQNQNHSTQIENLSREMELLKETTEQLHSQNAGLIEQNQNKVKLIAMLDGENKKLRRTLEPLQTQNVELTQQNQNNIAYIERLKREIELLRSTNEHLQTQHSVLTERNQHLMTQVENQNGEGSVNPRPLPTRSRKRKQDAFSNINLNLFNLHFNPRNNIQTSSVASQESNIPETTVTSQELNDLVDITPSTLNFLLESQVDGNFSSTETLSNAVVGGTGAINNDQIDSLLFSENSSTVQTPSAEITSTIPIVDTSLTTNPSNEFSESVVSGGLTESELGFNITDIDWTLFFAATTSSSTISTENQVDELKNNKI